MPAEGSPVVELFAVALGRGVFVGLGVGLDFAVGRGFGVGCVGFAAWRPWPFVRVVTWWPWVAVADPDPRAFLPAGVA